MSAALDRDRHPFVLVWSIGNALNECMAGSQFAGGYHRERHNNWQHPRYHGLDYNLYYVEKHGFESNDRGYPKQHFAACRALSDRA